MPYVVCALILRIISNPCANLLQKKMSAFESSFSVNLYSSLFALLCCLPFVQNVNPATLNFDFFTLVLISGMLCFLGTICLIKALSLGEMSVLGPVNSYKSVIGLVFSFLLLHEIPTLKALAGFFIIIFASFFFLDNEGKFILNKSVALRLLALVFTGIEAVVIKKIISISSPIEALIFWCLSGVLFSFLFALVFKKIKIKNKKTLVLCGITGVLLFIMQLSTNYVFEHLNVGLSLSLFQLSSVVSLIFGFKFFKEKGILKKSIGTCLMLFGSVLILV